MTRFMPAFLVIWGAITLAAWLRIQSLTVDGSYTPEMTGLWPPFHPYYFNVLYATVAIFPAVVLGRAALRSYGSRGQLGRGLLFLSLGVIGWCIGNTVWFWYGSCPHWPVLSCAHGTEAPYPSFADIAFLSLIPLYGYAFLQLWRLLGIDRRTVLSLLWIPIVIAIPTIWLTAPPFELFGFQVEARSWLFSPDYSPAESGFSIGYVTSDVLIMSAALILLLQSRKVAGGMLFRPLLIVVASLASLYVADLLFDRNVAYEYYYNGDESDGMYALSMWLMCVALASFVGVARRYSAALAAEALDDDEDDDDLEPAGAPPAAGTDRVGV